MPGFQLAKLSIKTFNSNTKVEGLLLLNHGIFTFGDNAKEAYSLMIKYVSQAERAIKKLKSKKIKQIKNYSTKSLTTKIRSRKNAYLNKIKMF